MVFRFFFCFAVNSFHSVSFHFVSNVKKWTPRQRRWQFIIIFCNKNTNTYIVFHSEWSSVQLYCGGRANVTRLGLQFVALHRTWCTQSNPLVSSVNAMRWWDYRSKTRGQRRTVCTKSSCHMNTIKFNEFPHLHFRHLRERRRRRHNGWHCVDVVVVAQLNGWVAMIIARWINWNNFSYSSPASSSSFLCFIRF